MNSPRIGIVLAVALGVLVYLLATGRVSANQPALVPGPDQLRYQLIGNEPIAGPDGRSVVNGWSVLVFKDRTASSCYVAFKQGAAISATAAATCPQ